MLNISHLTKDDITKAIKYIDEHGVPQKNKSLSYDLLTTNGKKYPPKYVVSVAYYLATGKELNSNDFNSISARHFLKRKGFVIETKLNKFELHITRHTISSTDPEFTMADLTVGDQYQYVDCYFEQANGNRIRRKFAKNERNLSNKVLTRLVFQIFEDDIYQLTDEEKEVFPIHQSTSDSEIIRGIFPSVEAYKQYRNTNEYTKYKYNNETDFVIYGWNVFSALLFAQECLKRFGKTGDQFILKYKEKETEKSEEMEVNEMIKEKLSQQSEEYQNKYSSDLIDTMNIIFRGAPGTGKSYLAKEIAADIISNGKTLDYAELTEEQKLQVEFVQFHPSYDYSDFVEGLRPTINDDGSMGFELQEGIFTQFVNRAQKNYDNSQKTTETIEREEIAQQKISDYLSNIELGVDELSILSGRKFTITELNEKYITISIPENAVSNQLKLNINELSQMLESDQEFKKVKDITDFFGKLNPTQNYSYLLAIYNDINNRQPIKIHSITEPEEIKPYIFIIDEINRGEISKIFGQLFFAIDPGYRGRKGEISTQYANLHENPNKKFSIPPNVYIIGTMNDIDRSVDSFDFAMRRRFRFIEIKSDERLEMLEQLKDVREEAIIRMKALNQAISEVEDLNENYHIGASYYLKLKDITFDQLWTDYLQPLLQEYVRGMYDEEAIMLRFEKAYNNKQEYRTGDLNDTNEN